MNLDLKQDPEEKKRGEDKMPGARSQAIASQPARRSSESQLHRKRK